MLEVQVLVDHSASHDALKALTAWADTLDIAYAWAASAGESAPHWKLLPLERVRRAILGIHFAQTEPHVLRKLRDLNLLRVIADTSGVFHPKLILGVKGLDARAIVGSSNFTHGGFAGNTEINVLLGGPAASPPMQQLLSFVETQWGHPRAFEPDDTWLEEYERLYEKRPAPPKVGTTKTHTARIVEKSDDLTLEWPDFFELISKQERRALWTGLEIHVFDHSEGSYLQEAEGCQAAFASEQNYAKMSEADRKLVAGWGERTAGYYGRMQGAGYFKNLTRERPSAIGEHLDRIPLTGTVSAAQTRSFLNGVMGIQGVALGTATRLLCMKRPDLFLPANRASVANIKRVFGIMLNTIDKYIALIERVWQYPWFTAPEPRIVMARRVWRARVALLDAIFYEPPEYLKA